MCEQKMTEEDEKKKKTQIHISMKCDTSNACAIVLSKILYAVARIIVCTNKRRQFTCLFMFSGTVDRDNVAARTKDLSPKSRKRNSFAGVIHNEKQHTHTQTIHENYDAIQPIMFLYASFNRYSDLSCSLTSSSSSSQIEWKRRR